MHVTQLAVEDESGVKLAEGQVVRDHFLLVAQQSTEATAPIVVDLNYHPLPQLVFEVC